MLDEAKTSDADRHLAWDRMQGFPTLVDGAGNALELQPVIATIFELGGWVLYGAEHDLSTEFSQRRRLSGLLLRHRMWQRRSREVDCAIAAPNAVRRCRNRPRRRTGLPGSEKPHTELARPKLSILTCCRCCDTSSRHVARPLIRPIGLSF